MKNKYGPDTLFLEFSLDIKEMYCELPHDIILRSIDFLIENCRELTRSEFISVPFKKDLEMRFGKSSNNLQNAVFHFDSITFIVKFDLENEFLV